ncbi:hypothetical protein [Sphingobium phenoxybenzoativorans]|uniref:hypothetical protein n=1 Tax=Sphingobium phenoxybenzoativorans TaxID=1592790 RepID=UPI001112EA81|nr:hypothetical protein [Sphingobium phenoxybenzoativorans]
MTLRWSTLTLVALLATACAQSGQSEAEKDWEFATSADVLGLSTDDIEKRLGKPALKEDSAGPTTGGLAYNIGECQVEYSFRDSKIWLVRVKLVGGCKPALKGVAGLTGKALSKGMTFSALPAAFTGSWRGTCIGPTCGTYPATIWFYHVQAQERSVPEISLESHLDEKAEMAARDAWSTALIGKAGVYSARLDELAICGTADQVAATHILKGMKIDAINFGYGLDPAPTRGCPKPNPAVAISGTGSRTSGQQALAAPSVEQDGPSNSPLAGQIAAGWVPRGESCESDIGITFAGDGTWSTVAESGSWSISGSQLTMITTEHGEGDGEEWIKLSPPRTHKAQLSISGKIMTQRFPDETIILQHCP